MKAYSQDLREQIVRAVAMGMPKAEAARTYQVALSTVKHYVARQERTGSLQAKTSPGRPRAISRDQEPALEAQFRADPHATILEHVRVWREQYGPVSPDAIRRTIRRLAGASKKGSGGNRAGRWSMGGVAYGERLPRHQRSCHRRRDDLLVCPESSLWLPRMSERRVRFPAITGNSPPWSPP